MRSLLPYFSALALTFSVAACGDDGGGDDGNGNGNTADAAVDTTPDAMPQPVGGTEGTACQATQENPSGGCAAGFLCLATSAGGAGQCFRDCSSDQNSCSAYSGPGVSSCGISIQDQNMMTVGMACGVICNDTTGNVPGCMGAACDGTCPGSWSCVEQTGQNAGISVCQ